MNDVLIPYADAASAAEVVRSTQLWLERAVIGLNLCPFAKAVHVKRQIRYAVTAATSAAIQPSKGRSCLCCHVVPQRSRPNGVLVPLGSMS